MFAHLVAVYIRRRVSFYPFPIQGPIQNFVQNIKGVESSGYCEGAVSEINMQGLVVFQKLGASGFSRNGPPLTAPAIVIINPPFGGNASLIRRLILLADTLEAFAMLSNWETAHF